MKGLGKQGQDSLSCMELHVCTQETRPVLCPLLLPCKQIQKSAGESPSMYHHAEHLAVLRKAVSRNGPSRPRAALAKCVLSVSEGELIKQSVPWQILSLGLQFQDKWHLAPFPKGILCVMHT